MNKNKEVQESSKRVLKSQKKLNLFKWKEALVKTRC